MTIGEVGPGGGQVVPEFRDLVMRYVTSYSLEPDAQMLVERMLQRGSSEVMSVADSGVRRHAITSASQRLEVALIAITRELDRTGTTYLDKASLEAAMFSVCPVPPFCLGTSLDPEWAGNLTSPAGAAREPATAHS